MPELFYTLLIWSGWIAGVLIFLNFLTCWVMPWAKKCEERETCKHKGCPEESKPLCAYHKIIAWVTIIAVSIHIILSIMYI